MCALWLPWLFCITELYQSEYLEYLLFVVLVYFIHVIYFYKPCLVLGKLDKKHYLFSKAKNQEAFLANQPIDAYSVDISNLSIWSYQKLS